MKTITKMKFFIVIIILYIFTSCNYMNTDIVLNTKVNGKEYINNGDDSYYIIYTDKGEYTIEDELLRANFKSSSWYGSIIIGKCYNFEVGGYRNGFLSMYKNIHKKPIEVDCNCDNQYDSINKKTINKGNLDDVCAVKDSIIKIATDSIIDVAKQVIINKKVESDSIVKVETDSIIKDANKEIEKVAKKEIKKVIESTRE